MRLNSLESSELPLGLPGPNTGILNSQPQENSPGDQRDLSLGLLQLSGRNALPQNPMWKRWESGNSIRPNHLELKPPFITALNRMQESFRDGGMRRGIEELAV